MAWKGLIGTFFTRVCGLSTLCFSHYYLIVTGVLPCFSSTAHGPNKCVLASDIKITADLLVLVYGVYLSLVMCYINHEQWTHGNGWMTMKRPRVFLRPLQVVVWFLVRVIPVKRCISEGSGLHCPNNALQQLLGLTKIDYSHMRITTIRDVTCPQYL